LFTVHDPVGRLVDMEQDELEIAADEAEALSGADVGLAVLSVLSDGHIELPAASIVVGHHHGSLLVNVSEAGAPEATASAGGAAAPSAHEHPLGVRPRLRRRWQPWGGEGIGRAAGADHCHVPQVLAVITLQIVQLALEKKQAKALYAYIYTC
jgi:hypothetical protein